MFIIGYRHLCVKLGWHGPTDASDLCLFTVDDPLLVRIRENQLYVPTSRLFQEFDGLDEPVGGVFVGHLGDGCSDRLIYFLDRPVYELLHVLLAERPEQAEREVRSGELLQEGTDLG